MESDSETSLSIPRCAMTDRSLDSSLNNRMRESDLTPARNDYDRLLRAQQMGFNTNVVVYHGTMSDPFDAFDKERLGSYTGSPSAKLGFFFGTSRENSLSYSGGDPDLVKFKKMPALSAIVTDIKAKCKEAGLPPGFSMGMSSGSALPQMVDMNDKTTDTDRIKAALLTNINNRFKASVKNAKDYIQAYKAGEYKPLRKYNTPAFVEAQVKLLKKQHDIALQTVRDWSEPLETKDWGSVHAFYLKMHNTYTVDQQSGSRIGSFGETIEKARKAGYDSVIILNTYDPKPTDVYVVFEPEQIRSVDAAFDLDQEHSANLMA
jgi:hypothetical protein